MQMLTGRPMKGMNLQRLQRFLKTCSLSYDEGVSFTAMLEDEDGEIIAAGSLDGNTLKCIAVSPMHQGEDLTARILTELRKEAFDRGCDHLMLFTKPGNLSIFSAFGFYPVMRTADCLLMENKRSGIADFVKALEKPQVQGSVGCIVANCNPFTNGHRYLMETAASQVDVLHVFVLSEKKSAFAPEVRMELVRRGTAHIKNIVLHPTGPYMVSSGTFPSYFIKDKGRVGSIHCELDVRIFAEKIAPALNITKRFVGTEPNCQVTAFYNEQMKARLPEYGIEVIEIPRLEEGGSAVSASRVRALLAEGKIEEIRPLVPDSTYEYLKTGR